MEVAFLLEAGKVDWATETSQDTSDAYCMIRRQVAVEGPCHGERDHPEFGVEGYGGWSDGMILRVRVSKEVEASKVLYIADLFIFVHWMDA